MQPNHLRTASSIKRLIFTLLTSWLALLALGAAAQTPKRVALLIGNAAYAHERVLKNPVNDAALLGRVLKDELRFSDVQVESNLSAHAMDRVVDAFVRRAQGADSVVFYYSGHGMKSPDRRNFLLPVDARTGRDDSPTLERQAVSAESIRDKLKPLGARVTLVILDACRDGPGAGRSGNKGLARMGGASNLLVAYATEEDRVAADGTGTNSPYAQALASALRKTNLPLLAQFDLVSDEVRKVVPQQEPTREGNLRADTYLISSVVPEPVTQPARPMATPVPTLPAAANRPIEKPDTGVVVPAPTGQTSSKPNPLKIAFAYVGPVGDGGWTFAHDLGRQAVEKEFGDRVVTSFVEKVPESADAERVFRSIVADGNKLIFGTTFGYMEPMLKVAGSNKGVRFEHATGYKRTENMRSYDSRTYEGAYLAGIVAGGMTKSKILGVVASIPIPEIIRNINSFTLGAQSVNPNIKTRVFWVNEWFNPPKEAEAATELIRGGADVLMQNTDSHAVLQTAEKMGKRAFGWDSDMRHYGPKAHLGSAVNNWGPYYIKATRDALDGKWATGSAWWGVKEGAIDLVSIAADVPMDLRRRVESVKAGLINGSHIIWKGPIFSSDGREMVGTNKVSDDRFLSGINFYVKGVEGRVPGSK